MASDPELNPHTLEFVKYRKLYLSKMLSKNGKKTYKKLYKLWLKAALRFIDSNFEDKK